MRQQPHPTGQHHQLEPEAATNARIHARARQAAIVGEVLALVTLISGGVLVVSGVEDSETTGMIMAFIGALLLFFGYRLAKSAYRLYRLDAAAGRKVLRAIALLYVVPLGTLEGTFNGDLATHMGRVIGSAVFLVIFIAATWLVRAAVTGLTQSAYGPPGGARR
jgi:hypothetical protein